MDSIGFEQKSGLIDGDLFHLYRRLGPVTGCGGGRLDGLDHIHAVDNAPKYRMLGRTRSKPVQVGVVDRVDKKLRSSAVWLSGVGHGKRSRLIGQFGVFGKLVLNPSIWRIAGSGSRALRISAVGATELTHEVFDHPMKMQSIIKPVVDKLYEVTRSIGHFV